MGKDILLDENNDLKITSGDFAIGESEMQEVEMILSTNQGEWKEHPVTGANLVTQIRTTNNDARLERMLRIQMKLDGKDYEQIKNKIKMNLNG
ncbi:hypothetical protein ML462_14090 [Gramella lutea]|uniref:Uncharacterized protein n=1 Tax=Christiangramia lutea TaxID=1607951 RepID=A0A9X1V4L0_9FLAO|nr:hypothetical protein [Christiangramia lutea]MCH4824302.1 hypothetical protein [Christiangramia lutea]